jgi:hypothetical protein
MAAGKDEDFIQLRIEDSNGSKIFETPDFGKAGTLTGKAVNALIPPGKLNPNTTYNATLFFQKNVTLDWSSYPGVLAASFYFARTSFTIATSAAGKPDVDTYEVMKGSTFVQSDTSAPVPSVGEEYTFEAQVDGTDARLLNNSSFGTPINTVITLLPDSDRQKFEYVYAAPSAGLLDSSYFNGMYRFSIGTVHDGLRSPELYFPPCPFPPAPRLSNFNPGVKIRANQDLRLQWEAWPAGPDIQFVQLRIEDTSNNKVFKTGDLGESDALDARSTEIVVPSGTLVPGKSYRARLLFKKIVAMDTSGYPAALGLASYYAKTKFDIDTEPPDVKTFSVLKGREFTQTDSGAPVPNVSTAFVFTATVIASAPDSLNGAWVTTPRGTTQALLRQADGKTFLFVDGCDNQSMVDTSYPDGTYSLRMSTAHEGTPTISLALSGARYPNPPHLSDFESTQLVEPAGTLILRWDAFTNGTTNDFIYLDFSDVLGNVPFTSKAFGKSSALDGLANALPVPNGTFVPSQLYQGRLLFQTTVSVDDSDYSGAEGVSGYFESRLTTL